MLFKVSNLHNFRRFNRTTYFTFSNNIIYQKMAKYKQGTAPAVVFENNKVVFAFREGKLEIKDEMVRKNGCELHKKLIQYGAICVAGNPMKVG